MPQIHHVLSHGAAFRTAHNKIGRAPDDASAIVGAHLIIEALLHAIIRSRVANRSAVEDANLRFYQALCLVRALRRKLKREDWIWKTLDQLNSIRNRLAHDIQVPDLVARIERLYAAAGSHIDIYAPGADPKDREDNRLKVFLIILCGVVHGLQRAKKR